MTESVARRLDKHEETLKKLLEDAREHGDAEYMQLLKIIKMLHAAQESANTQQISQTKTLLNLINIQSKRIDSLVKYLSKN